MIHAPETPSVGMVLVRKQALWVMRAVCPVRRRSRWFAVLVLRVRAARVSPGASLSLDLIGGSDQTFRPRVPTAASSFFLLALLFLLADVEVFVSVPVLRWKVLQQGPVETPLQRLCHDGVFWEKKNHQCFKLKSD